VFQKCLPGRTALPLGAKGWHFLLAYGGTAEQAAEKLVPAQKVRPQRLKPDSKQNAYRSAEALRHPKSRATSGFSASCEAVPCPNLFLRHAVVLFPGRCESPQRL
jgi:hypothetical protein